MDKGIWELRWQDVFDCRKLYPSNYDQCREKVKSVGYSYMEFNGLVYSVHDATMENPYCRSEELK